MAYAGYLVKIGDDPGAYVFPNEKILIDTYDSKANTLFDLASPDADGITRYHVLAHKVTKINFKTVPMTDKDFTAIMANILARCTDTIAMTFNCTFYEQETGNYITRSCHLADLQPSINRVDDVNNIIYYNPIQMTITVW